MVAGNPQIFMRGRINLAIPRIPAIASPRTLFSASMESANWLHPFPVFIDERLFEVTPTAHRHRLPPIRDEAGNKTHDPDRI